MLGFQVVEWISWHTFICVVGLFLITLVIPSDQDADEDDYNTMVVKEDDNESVVSNFMFLGLDEICIIGHQTWDETTGDL